MAQLMSSRLVTEIASRKSVEPASVEPPLYEVVDPDALDSLFTGTDSTTRTKGRVKFDYAGYQVIVSADHAISLSRLATEEDVDTSATSGPADR